MGARLSKGFRMPGHNSVGSDPMEMSDYAERVLFSASLTDKLIEPSRLTDINPGAGIEIPKAPARPKGLRMGDDTKRPKFPTLSELDSAPARGRVLHFFANHELLALELMALTLLRFPKAPSRFRKRLIATMRDEQKHMKLYMSRMSALGVEMGEIPLNSFFWDQLSTVESVRQFVAGMSLTFEQANLDFSLHYRNLFRQVGDDETASIMETVLRDEVAHVRHGMDYLNRTRSPDLSQWQDYLEALNFPLTPARGKGAIFSRSHRQAAGLNEEFIDQMQVYAHSKGRVPDVYYFNPDVERRLGFSEGAITPSGALRRLQKDLEHLPMFLAVPDDVVVVSKRPPASHLAALKALGYGIPEFAETQLGGNGPTGSNRLKARKVGCLRPWGWDADSCSFFKRLVSDYASPSLGLDDFVDKRQHLYSKVWLGRQVDSLLKSLPEAYRAHCLTNPVPIIVENLADIHAACGAFIELGYSTSVIKSPFGTAGSGKKICQHGKLAKSSTRWIEKQLAQHGKLVVEPWFENQADLSYLFRMDKSGDIRTVGLSHFATDKQGRYRGAYLGRPQHTLDSILRRFLCSAGGNATWVKQTLEHLAKGLAPHMVAANFEGRAGLDFMIVRDANQALKLRVPLELNPRPTMGHIAVALRKPLGSRSTGVWLHVTFRDLQATPFESFEILLAHLHEKLPAQWAGTPARLTQGAFSTNEPSTQTQVLSLCLVAKTLDQIRSLIAETFGRNNYVSITQIEPSPHQH